jgi:hypothetical protein
MVRKDMPSESQMRRLAIARHLHRQSADQAGQGDLLSGLALLPLHDATEILLQTAAEHKKVQLPRKLEFLEYWGAFETAGFPLPFKTEMDRFNRARVEVPRHFLLSMTLLGFELPSRSF